MNIKESYNNLVERLKFPQYARKEAEIETPLDSSQTALPQQEEHPSGILYEPFATYSSENFNPQTALLISNKNEMLRKWRESSYLPEVDAALNEISNEAIVFDEIEDAIKINLNDIEIPELVKNRITESFDKILYLLDFNARGDELFKQWYIDGQLNIECVYDNERMREGIKKLILLTPFNFNSYVDPNTKTKKYFYTTGVSNTSSAAITGNIFDEEQITSIGSGLWSLDRKFPISYLNKSIKTINQLALIEDSLVIIRITKSTEKRAFYIPTGNLNKAKGEEYLRSLISKFRQKRTYNLDTGTVENKNRSISLLEDYWFAVDKNGTSPRIENVAGTNPGFTSYEDVDYFVNKLYKSLNIPLNRRNSDVRMTQGNQIDIEKDELRFFKYILKLRRKFNNLFIDLLKKDLLAKNVLTIQDWNNIQEKIKFIYSNSNEYSEIKHLQILESKINVANSAMALVEPGLISKEWIQDDIFKFSQEDKNKIEMQKNKENGMASEQEEAATDDFSSEEFGNDYEIRRRNTLKPTMPTKKEPISTGDEHITGETTPSVEIPKENKTPTSENILNEKLSPNTLLSILEEGDIITDGKTKLKYINGELMEVE